MTEYYIVYRDGCLGEKGKEKTLLKVGSEGIFRYDRFTKKWISDNRAMEFALKWPDKTKMPESEVSNHIAKFDKRDAPHL